MNTKQLVFVAVMLIATGSLYAQGNGSAGITEATKMVTSYFDPGTKLCYAIGAVVGLVGGIKVYNKVSSGDPVFPLHDDRIKHPHQKRYPQPN